MISDDLLFDVAIDYYVKNMLQKDIALKHDVSRVQISKYLKMARERGIVQIEVNYPSIKRSVQDDYQHFFTKTFGIKRLLLTSSASNEKRLIEALCRKAATYIRQLPRRELKIGLGWGSTIFTLSESMETADRPDWEIVPLSGGTTRLSDKRFNVNHIVQNFADKTHSRAIPMYLPFIVDNAEQMKNSKTSAEYTSINGLWNSLDVVICSVGYSIARSPLFRQNVFDDLYADRLEKLEVVGDVLTHYFDINGSIHELEVMKNCMNLSIEQYRKAGERIIIAGGHHKVDGIVGLLRGGLVDTLITDESTAKYVKDYVSEGGV